MKRWYLIIICLLLIPMALGDTETIVNSHNTTWWYQYGSNGDNATWIAVSGTPTNNVDRSEGTNDAIQYQQYNFSTDYDYRIDGVYICDTHGGANSRFALIGIDNKTSDGGDMYNGGMWIQMWLDCRNNQNQNIRQGLRAMLETDGYDIADVSENEHHSLFSWEINISSNKGYYMSLDGNEVFSGTYDDEIQSGKPYYLAQGFYSGNDQYEAGWDDITLIQIERGASNSATWNTDLVNNTENYNDVELNYTYNATVVGYDSNFNCSYFVNDTNTDNFEVDLDNTHEYNITLGGAGIINMSINCSNAETTIESGTYYYSFDLINPIITSNFTNSSVFKQYANETFDYTCEDTNIHATNRSIYNDTGLFAGSLGFIENLTANYGNTTVFEMLETGNFTYRIDCWDSHTKAVREYNITFGDTWIDYNNEVRLDSFDVSELASWKTDDEYKIFVKWNTIEPTKRINITSIYPINRISNSEYFGHHIILYGGYWIDFKHDELYDYEYTFNKLSPYKIEVVMYKAEGIEEVEFESIGDLNTDTEFYDFEVVTCTAVYENISCNDYYDDTACDGRTTHVMNRSCTRTDNATCPRSDADSTITEQRVFDCRYGTHGGGGNAYVPKEKVIEVDSFVDKIVEFATREISIPKNIPKISSVVLTYVDWFFVVNDQHTLVGIYYWSLVVIVLLITKRLGIW